MTEIESFIASARAKQLSDEQIHDMLVANGWSQPQVDAALSGLTVPTPMTNQPVAPTAPLAVSEPAHAGRPSISALQAALQHVLLWVFTLTSTIMITTVSVALFASGSSGGSSEALLTYVVLEAVTFAPFAFFYWRYLQQRRQRPELMTGKIWSIITVVLHSIGLIGAVIALILVAILTHDNSSIAGLLSSGAIAIMNALVVTAYVSANFAKAPQSLGKVLLGFPIALFILISLFGSFALFRVGPLRSDDQATQNLVSAAEEIHEYARQNKKLPASKSDVSKIADSVSYEKTGDDSYQLCASFKKENDSGYSSSRNTISDDSYVSTYDFRDHSKGSNCWQLNNTELTLSTQDGTNTSTNGVNIFDNTNSLPSTD